MFERPVNKPEVHSPKVPRIKLIESVQHHSPRSALPWSIRMVSPQRLKASPRNAKTHPKKQIAQIADSIRRFGYTNPILVDETLEIIAGHARVAAAQQAGLSEIPVIVISNLSDAKKRALALADNKIAENGGWDAPVLAAELAELATLLPTEDLDLGITGFGSAELDELMGSLVDPERDPDDSAPAISDEAVSGVGDKWHAGDHRLVCGDAMKAEDFRTLMGRRQAAMVFTDPPYNVPIRSVQGRGRRRHREFVSGSGEMSRAEFTNFLTSVFELCVAYSILGSIHFVCMDWRHMSEILNAGEKVFEILKNLIVWAKTNAGQGSFYRSQHELIFLFKNGDVPHINNFELGQHGRRRSNVWTYAGANSFRKGRLDDLSMHPTVKPVAMVADAMRDCSRRGDIVLDPFMGSGTTILAAEKVGRRAYGLELDPLYVDVAIRRWQTYTGRDAILRSTGQTFDEVAAARAAKRARRAK